MPKLPFPSGYYEIKNLPKSRENLVNLFNNGEGAVLPRPGIDKIETFDGIARAEFEWNGSLYAIYNTKLYKMTDPETGANTLVGNVSGNEIVETAIGFNTAVLVVKGGEIYTLDKSDTIA